MREGRQHEFAGPGEWLAALRGLRDNPVRRYLLAVQRRRWRKLHFWLRPDLIYFIAAALAAAALGFFIFDICTGAHPGARIAEAWSKLVLTYQFAGYWPVGLLLGLWWMQGMYLWVNDALSLFSYDRTQPQALPVEFAMLPERDTAFVTGALSALLPPLLWRVLGAIVAFNILLPWPVLSNLDINYGTYSWPPASYFLNLYFPGGVLILSLSAAICATALTCMLFVASHRGLPPGIRVACAYALPLIQVASTLFINKYYWESGFRFEQSQNPILLQNAEYLPITVLMVAAVFILSALARTRAKTTLAVAATFLPALAALAAGMVITTIYSYSTGIPTELPSAWAGGFYVLVNPLAAPDPALNLAGPKWYYPDAGELEAAYKALSAFERELGATPGPIPHEVPHRPMVWPCASAIHFLMLLIIAAIGLEAARLSAAQWRLAG